MSTREINQSAIQAIGLEKRFGDFTAVDGINFQVEKGIIFGFLGPNGSGKTTTIRMLLGLLRPTSGSVEVLGIPVKDHPERIRPHIGYMSQRFSLYNDLTVMQNLRFYGKAYGLRNETLKERINVAIEMAGLSGHEKTKTRDLAGGWRQRLALGASILHQPEIIFLDEPTAGVDPVSRRSFWDLLYNLVSGGVTVFVTTHYMDEAEHCHRLAFIQRGKIIAYGAPEQIKHDMMRGQVLEIETDNSMLALKALREVQANQKIPLEEVALYGSLVHVVSPGMNELTDPIAKLLENSGIRINNLAIIEPSLEDVFISSMRSDDSI